MRWVTLCVCSDKYSININGSLEGYFLGRKGLCQGNPISPYLFVLTMEYLSRSCALIVNDPLFKFHLKCRCTQTSYVSFANDLMLFGYGDLPSVCCVKKFWLIFLLCVA